MEDNSNKPKKSILKRIIRLLGVTIFSFILLIVGSAVYIAINDKAAKSPLYTGPIIPDEFQIPIDNNFDHHTEAVDVVQGLDLKGKIIVMTGGHSGTGREATKAFVSRGATVIALARDVEWAKRKLKGLPNIEIEYLDLLKPKSIEAFTQKFLKSNRPIHALINSAGIYNIPLIRDKRGYELQFATNVLGHYELIMKLLPALKKANGARIVNLSSRGHRLSNVLIDDVNFEHTKYDGMISYVQSKTALILLTVKLDELLRDSDIRTFAVHPGPIPSSDLFASSQVGIASNTKVQFMKASAKLSRAINYTWLLNFFRNPENVGDIYKTVKEGGATTAWAAVSPELNGKGGLYLEDCNIAKLVPNDSNAPFGVRQYALDMESADQVLKICENMTGIIF
ncbi:NAD(P)-dependent dehydrogenase (short-subunit alcohol dehydrogenase family) [Tenacibaculum adriaticum]|uniref:NAD(P)-dependent dehydrogenase (Short-subunit alcohol dehydrogenase family) n=1 Tax=Tenacibaculum adriaticum TaxID=413713 RepID=A0A5S5DNZ5_9FLAO|nr:SDR family NAD(P)-dependent oxidoreductase [Tenacibaculum adriaticum]TYP97445.1 NAD(P)-dependent dehydrogenase (short-subunit alcohol dehydrogenase family) [Tenacibaculum adriaticum]